MSGIRSVLSTTAVVVGAGAALLTGGIAKADPGAPPPAPVPSVPGLSMVEQFIDPAKAPQLLQNAAAILTGTPAAPAAPPAPSATASVNLPQQIPGLPATAPGVPATAPGVPATAPGIPAAAPGIPATAPTLPVGTPTLPDATQTLPGTTQALPQPGAEITLPQVPGLPVPLPQQVSFPGDLAGLLPVGVAAMTPAQAAATAAGSPSAASPLTGPALASLFPTAALP